MAYTTTAAVKAYLGTSESGDDTLLANAIADAVAIIEAQTGWTFEAAAATRYYGRDAVRGNVLRLDEGLISVTTLVQPDTDETEIASTEYWLLPRNEGPPYFKIELKAASSNSWAFSSDCWVAVTGLWGYSTSPPADIVRAVKVLAAFLYRQKDAQVFDVIALPGGGELSVPRGMPAAVWGIIRLYQRRL